MPSISVLVVDDSALMRRAIKGILEEAGGFEVHTARNGVLRRTTAAGCPRCWTTATSSGSPA